MRKGIEEDEIKVNAYTRTVSETDQKADILRDERELTSVFRQREEQQQNSLKYFDHDRLPLCLASVCG